MIRVLSVIIFCTYSIILHAQSIKYKLNLKNIVHHELEITIEYTNISKDSLLLEIANSSPGRYAIHNFGKNIYGESAYDKNGQKVTLVRKTPLSWKVATKDGYVKFVYTLFGNYADGTYAGIDNKRLHLNIPASFVFTKDLKELPISVDIDLSQKPDWRIATQLEKIDGNTYRAPNWYYFMDSPIMAGEMDFASWQVDGQTIEVAMMHEGTTAEFNDFVENVKKIVVEERDIFGELPSFDFGRYTFLCAYNPWVHGDGMEHRNSTICTSTGNLKENAQRLLGTIAHEFFHAWNIERIRPLTLEPFQFDQGNVSGELWFGEGFTNYFDEITLTRAGIQSGEEFIKKFNRTFNYVKDFPGRTIRNPIQMSQNATFTDAGVANDETNYSNTFVSYYSYGEVLGMGLDLMLRTEQKKSLDGFMKLVWKKYGKTEKPYTINELRKTLTEYTNATFANNFFDQHILASELPNFEQLFEKIGVTYTLANPSKVNSGMSRVDDQGVVQAYPFYNTPLYDAGISIGDKILSINEMAITAENSYNDIIESLEVGKTYTISFEQMGETVKSSFTTSQNPTISLQWIDENKVSKSAQKLRKGWVE
ncbi:MAG: M61 family peptidase [Cyclobacteriaceae bacterium]